MARVIEVLVIGSGCGGRVAAARVPARVLEDRRP
jgi:hypothetical protein